MDIITVLDKKNMSVNSQYLQAVIKYLTVVEEAEVESTEFKGMQGLMS